MILYSVELNFLPPPKSNRYLTSKNGKRFIPYRIKEAINDTIYILQSFKTQTISKPCQLYIRYTLPDRRERDLDNLNKTLQDCLEKAGIVEKDALFYRVISEKRFSDKKEEKVEIVIYDLKTPIILPSI